MLKNMSRLEVVIAEKAYHFMCEMDSPLTHVKEALMKIIYYVGQIEESIAAQAKAAEEKAKSEEEIKKEVDTPWDTPVA